MNLQVNGETKTLPDGSRVPALLEALGLTGAPCAVELNARVVPKSQHAETTLAEGDRVEIVTLVGGG